MGYLWSSQIKKNINLNSMLLDYSPHINDSEVIDGYNLTGYTWWISSDEAWGPWTFLYLHDQPLLSVLLLRSALV